MLFLFSSLLLLASCDNSAHKPTFQLLSSSTTGVDFSNDISETDSFNILTTEFIYNGGGVAVGDLNGDGLTDLFFAGNQVDNKLYINQGSLKFDDVSAMANVGENKSGTMVLRLEYTRY